MDQDLVIKLLHGVKNTTKAILDDQAAYCSFDRQI